MIGRVVEIAEDGRHLSLSRGFMRVEAGGAEVGRVALDDIAVVLANAHGLTYSNNLLVTLAERGVAVVLCGANHGPVAWLWPVSGHHAQTARMHAQVAATRPLGKRLWQALVVAKIVQQAAVLAAAGKPSGGVAALARKVRSGDPANVEAQAARRYWPLLLGSDFRRDRARPGVNALLNYGYTVLRAATARAVVSAGLHPSLGVHHRTRSDPFCLASDLMEPFRPIVDLAAARLAADGAEELTPEVKAALAAVPAADMESARGATPLATCLERLAGSLARTYETGEVALDLPTGLLPLDAARLGRR
ncbi:MAG: type II CRISPR-associated endonuclease Cas1 [Alphaproteobacteria bacterium]